MKLKFMQYQTWRFL